VSQEREFNFMIAVEDGGVDAIGLELMVDGSAVATPAPDTLDGILTWEVSGPISDLVCAGARRTFPLTPRHRIGSIGRPRSLPATIPPGTPSK
jgi:hypothetical protein